MKEREVFGGRYDKYSWGHLAGCAVLQFVFSLVFVLGWWVPELVVLALTNFVGVLWEVSGYDAYRSEDTIDLMDLAFNLVGSVVGLILFGLVFNIGG